MATTYTLADPLSVATQGFQNIYGTHDTLGIATVGWVIIEEEIIEPPEPPTPPPEGDGGGAGPGFDDIWDPWSHTKDDEKTKKKKKITVRAKVYDNIYEESVIVDDLTLNVKDVNVQIVNEDNQVKIKIILPEES